MTILSKTTLFIGILSLGLIYFPAYTMESDLDKKMMRPLISKAFHKLIKKHRPKDADPTHKTIKAENIKTPQFSIREYFDVDLNDQSLFMVLCPEIKCIINTFIMHPNLHFRQEHEKFYYGNPGKIVIQIKSMMTYNQYTHQEGYFQWLAITEHWNVENFTTWDLSTKQISTENIKILAKALQINKTLLKLNLADTGLMSEDVYIIAKMLRINKTLQELNLSSNNIKDAGLSCLIMVLTLHNSVLSHLNLSNSSFDQDICYSLGLFLEKNTSLTCLILDRFCNGNTLEISSLTKAIKQNSTLTELSLLDNSINAHKIAIFLEALKKNTTLKKLTLYYPPIKMDNEEDSTTDNSITKYGNDHGGIFLVEEFREKYGDRINFYD